MTAPSALLGSTAAADETSYSARLAAAGAAAVVGAILTGIADGSVPGLILLMIGGIPWAIAGAIAGRRLSVVKFALAFAAIGFMIAFGVTATMGERDAPVVSVVFGGEPGVILGALVGAARARRATKAVGSPAHS